MALSILKAKINKREYKKFSEFVRDCALVCNLYSLFETAMDVFGLND